MTQQTKIYSIRYYSMRYHKKINYYNVIHDNAIMHVVITNEWCIFFVCYVTRVNSWLVVACDNAIMHVVITNEWCIFFVCYVTRVNSWLVVACVFLTKFHVHFCKQQTRYCSDDALRQVHSQEFAVGGLFSFLEQKSASKVIKTGFLHTLQANGGAIASLAAPPPPRLRLCAGQFHFRNEKAFSNL